MPYTPSIIDRSCEGTERLTLTASMLLSLPALTAAPAPLPLTATCWAQVREHAVMAWAVLVEHKGDFRNLFM